MNIAAFLALLSFNGQETLSTIGAIEVFQLISIKTFTCNGGKW